MVVFLCLLLGCQSNDPKNAENFGTKQLLGGPDGLALAGLLIEYVPDISNKTFLYIRLARMYYQAGKVDLGSVVLQRALERIRASDSQSKHGLLLSLGTSMMQFGYKNQGKELIRESYALVLQLKEQAARGWALGEVIQTCFHFPESLGDILRDAVDYVYVLEDSVLKVQILTDLAFKYQELNSRGRVATIIQHVIISALGIDNAWYQIEAFSRIANAWKTEGDEETASEWLEKTLELMRKNKAMPGNSDELAKFMETLLRLTDFGRFSDVSAEVARISDPESRNSVQLALIGAYLKQGPSGVFQARLAIQRVLNQVSQEDSSGLAGASDRAGRVLVRLGEMYLDTKMLDDARRYTEAAVLYMEKHDLGGKDALRSRVAEIYARMGESSRAFVQMNVIVDPYLAAKTGVRLLELQAEKGEANAFVGMEAVLSGALQKARASNYMRDTMVSNVISVSWRLGKLETTMDFLPSIKDPFVLANTLMDTWKAGTGDTADRYRETVRRMMAEWEKAPLP